MAKIVYVCLRSQTGNRRWPDELRAVCSRLSPDDIHPSQLVEQYDECVHYGIVSPPSFLVRQGGSVALGAPAGLSPHWATPEAAIPEGTFALFRANARLVEVCTDALASRTIWYHHGEEAFLASTSQRAIVMLLRSIEINERAVPWMLSAGCLPPRESWDRRLNCLPPAARLRLDRESWSLSRSSEPIVFQEKDLDPKPGTCLETLLRRSVGRYSFNPKRWVVPLSGGYDSRGLVLLMGQEQRLDTLTWGQASALERSRSDAVVARRLSDELGLKNSYEVIDPSGEPPNVVLDRFLRLGEARIDHVGGYLDGFAIWKRLVELGIEGVVRGDEGFGWQPCATEDQARATVGMEWLTDFSNLSPYKDALPVQVMPEHLVRRSGETLAAWRDRLYHDFRIPTILAALTDLKVGYVEIANPYLSADVVRFVHSLPDNLRTNKILFRRVVERLTPDVPFATEAAIADRGAAMSSLSMKRLLSDELSAASSASTVPAGLRASVLKSLSSSRQVDSRPSSGFRSLVGRWLPRRAKALLRRSVAKRSVDPHTLAFRIYLIDRMSSLLADDSAFLLSTNPPTEGARSLGGADG